MCNTCNTCNSHDAYPKFKIKKNLQVRVFMSTRNFKYLNMWIIRAFLVYLYNKKPQVNIDYVRLRRIS